MPLTLAVGTRRIAGAFRLAAVILAGGSLIAACSDSSVAPSGSSVTLTATPGSLGFNGMASIVADVRKSDGQPAADGTVVSFGATLGSVQPDTAQSVAGKATVTFVAGAESGMAVITASSGSQASVRIPVGAAAATRLNMSAAPAAVPFNGGTSTISATVLDAGGKPLTSVPVSFTTTSGTVTPSSVKSDPSGIAQVVLTTSREASVTAVVGVAAAPAGDPNVVRGSVGVTLAPRPVPIVSIAASENPTMNQATTFTISAAPAANGGAAIQNVSINFGDGSRPLDLGAASGAAIVAQHVYLSPGSFTVAVTATDANGGSATVSTVIVVAAQAPLSVAIAASAPVDGGNTKVYTFVATVQPATVIIATYQWDFGDGSPVQVTTGAQVIHGFTKRAASSTYVIKVTVTSTPPVQTADALVVIPGGQ
jgi:PKD repeat protein